MKYGTIRSLVVVSILFGMNSAFGLGKIHFGYQKGGWKNPAAYLKARDIIKPSKALGQRSSPVEIGMWRAQKRYFGRRSNKSCRSAGKEG